jgi:hypothetical protein
LPAEFNTWESEKALISDAPFLLKRYKASHNNKDLGGYEITLSSFSSSSNVHELLSLDMENEQINSAEPEATSPLGQSKLHKNSRIRACMKSDFAAMTATP